MDEYSAQAVLPSWYQVPETIKNLLLSAVSAWENPERSESFIVQALEHPQTNLEVLISAYRYFYYRHNSGMARRLAMQVMDQIKAQENWPDEWVELEPILITRRHDPVVRLYLSAYTALGMMLARWGAFQAAIAITERIKKIDPQDEFGAGVIRKILTATEPLD
jgi:hypothetical protein